MPADKKDAALEAKPEDKPAPAPAPKPAEPTPAPVPPVPEPAKPAGPDKVKLMWLYAWRDENNREHVYREGDLVTDAATIATLIERKAPLLKEASPNHWVRMFPDMDKPEVH